MRSSKQFKVINVARYNVNLYHYLGKLFALNSLQIQIMDVEVNFGWNFRSEDK